MQRLKSKTKLHTIDTTDTIKAELLPQELTTDKKERLKSISNSYFLLFLNLYCKEKLAL